MVNKINFMSLPKEVRNKISDFIQEYVDISGRDSFDKKGEIVESVYKSAFKLLISEDIFTVKELRHQLFID